jgi:hypothetical protein
LLVVLFLIIFICNRQRHNNSHSSQGELVFISLKIYFVGKKLTDMSRHVRE